MSTLKLIARRAWRRRVPTLQFGFLMIVLMWAGTALEVRREFTSADQAMFRDTSNYARIFEESVLRSLKQIETQLWFVSLQAARTAKDRWPSIIKDLPLDKDLTIQIALIDDMGLVNASTVANPSANPIDLSDREHVRVHLDRKIEGLFISKPVIGRLSRRWSIQVSRAIKDDAGTVVGVAVASLDPAHLSRLYDGMSMRSDGSVLLFGRDGVVRAGAGVAASSLGQDISASRIAASDYPAEQGSLISSLPLGGRAMVTSWRRVAGFDLIVAVAQSSSPDVEEARNWSAILVSLAIFFSVIIGILSVRIAAGHQRLLVSETRLRRTRRQIERKSSWLKLTLENISQGIAMVDPSGHVVVSNRQLQQMMNSDGNPANACSVSLIKSVVAARRADGCAGEGKARSSTHVLDTGNVLKIVHVDLPNRGMVVTFEDITDSHRSQRQLLAAEQAAQAGNRAKSLFLASMSHELRTPMNGVIGMAQVLLDDEADSERRKCLETIIASGEAQMIIINDVLDYSRLEAGRLELRPVQFNLRKVLDELVTLLSARALERSIDFSIAYQSDMPSYFRGDVGRFRQIVTNLLGNAVKFTTGPSVSIAVGGSARGGLFEICVAVTDSGPGIPAEKLSLIFEDFTQLDNAANGDNSGTGLGLPICRRLAHLMGGRIDVVSEVGLGSTFSLTLPLEIDDTIAIEDTGLDLHQLSMEASARLARGRRILVLAAEDNKANRQVLVSMLKTENVDIVLACDGREVVDRYLDVSPDVVLMDLKMPHRDGYEATALIRELEREHGRARTPVIAISANAMRGDHQKCLDQDMDDYMSKPIQKKILIRMLEKWTRDCSAEARAAVAPWFANDRRSGENTMPKTNQLRIAAE